MGFNINCYCIVTSFQFTLSIIIPCESVTFHDAIILQIILRIITFYHKKSWIEYAASKLWWRARLQTMIRILRKKFHVHHDTFDILSNPKPMRLLAGIIIALWLEYQSCTGSGLVLWTKHGNPSRWYDERSCDMTSRFLDSSIFWNRKYSNRDKS